MRKGIQGSCALGLESAAFVGSQCSEVLSAPLTMILHVYYNIFLVP